MSGLVRFGISMEEDLLRKFDEVIKEKRYANRSEAIRDLVRDYLVKRYIDKQRSEGGGAGRVVGTLTLIYNHEVRELTDRLTSIQHDHHEHIVSTLHVHLDHHHCLEVLVVRGNLEDVQGIADQLVGMKGVLQGKLTLTTTDFRSV